MTSSDWFRDVTCHWSILAYLLC